MPRKSYPIPLSAVHTNEYWPSHTTNPPLILNPIALSTPPQPPTQDREYDIDHFAASVLGSVGLPLDYKHTQGKQIPMPIFVDEGLDMEV